MLPLIGRERGRIGQEVGLICPIGKASGGNRMMRNPRLADSGDSLAAAAAESDPARRGFVARDQDTEALYFLLKETLVVWIHCGIHASERAWFTGSERQSNVSQAFPDRSEGWLGQRPCPPHFLSMHPGCSNQPISLESGPEHTG